MVACGLQRREKSVMAASFDERRGEPHLDLCTLVEELNVAGLLSDEDRSRLAQANVGGVHPLVFLAEQKMTNAGSGGELDINALLHWLSGAANQAVYRIDPLKIKVGAIAEVMSLAFARRHQILAVEVNEDEVVIASAEPWVSAWESNLEHVLRKPIRRVLADPRDIRRHTAEFYAMARSVQGTHAGGANSHPPSIPHGLLLNGSRVGRDVIKGIIAVGFLHFRNNYMKSVVPILVAPLGFHMFGMAGKLAKRRLIFPIIDRIALAPVRRDPVFFAKKPRRGLRRLGNHCIKGEKLGIKVFLGENKTRH